MPTTMKIKPSQAPPMIGVKSNPFSDIGFQSATLWDHYAGAALTGLLLSRLMGNTIDEISSKSAEIADAMLAERARREME